MLKEKFVIVLLTAIGIIITPLLIFAWYLLPPEVVLPRLETTLVYQGTISGQYSDSVELRASLSERQSKKAIRGREIRFILEKQEISAITDTNGVAHASLRLNQAAKNYTILSIFAGDEQYHGSSDSDPFEILKEDTVLTYTGPLSGTQDETVTLSARLSERDASVGDLGGKIIIFRLGNIESRATTNSAGQSAAEMKLELSPGAYTLRSEFGGDGFYLASSDADTFEVRARAGAGRRCLIATAVFGSPLASEIEILRQFRDNYLLPNRFGKFIVEQYEQFSPGLAGLIAQNEKLRKTVRMGLKPIIEVLKLLP